MDLKATAFGVPRRERVSTPRIGTRSVSPLDDYNTVSVPEWLDSDGAIGSSDPGFESPSESALEPDPSYDEEE